MDIPPPILTVHDAILDLDRRFEKLTVPAVRNRLREMRGFDASTKEITAALRDFKNGEERCKWAAKAGERAWAELKPPEELDGTTARYWLNLSVWFWAEASKRARLRKLGETE